MGVLLWRGFTLDAVMAQCFGNEEDDCTKGRQMPVVCTPFLFIFKILQISPLFYFIYLSFLYRTNIQEITLLISLVSALRLADAPLPHYLVSIGDADTASSRRRLRVEARSQSERQELRGGVFWGGWVDLLAFVLGLRLKYLLCCFLLC